MQLNRPASVRQALALAACSLLAQPPSAAAGERDWASDVSGLYYTEPNRVTVNETEAVLQKGAADGESLRFRFVYDAISGASANGAVFSRHGTNAQTITSPSGSFKVTAGGKGAIDPLTPFIDTRFAGDLDWRRPLTRDLTGRFNAAASTENDYGSIGGGGALVLDLNQRLTTVTGGLNISQDVVRPVTGTPEGLQPVVAGEALGPGQKRVLDTLLGVTQVVSRRLLVQLNYTLGLAQGYLTDPYKVVSLVDPVSGDPTAAVFEQRPTVRHRNSVYGQANYHLTEDAVTLAYRYYWDDWGVRSHTIDLRYHYTLWRGAYLQPHLRYYTQSAAGFYHYSLDDGAPLPDVASADYRLGNLTSATAGLKLGVPFGKAANLRLRAEYLTQQDADGRFPSVNAFILQGSFVLLFLTIKLQSRPPPGVGTTLDRAPNAGRWIGRFQAMASPCELLIDGADRAQAWRALRVAQAEAERIERKFSRYRSGTIVHRINHADGAAVAVDAETAELLDYAATVYHVSSGAFDITCGVLRRVWNFDGSDRLPEPAAVRALLPSIGWSRVVWERPRLVLPRGMEIDLGGIGKEYAVDRVARRLGAAGVTAALINFGGDLFALGPRADGRPWTVGIDDPDATGRDPIGGIELRHGGLATSGDARRFLIKDGVRYGHVLDARTGWPAPGAPRSVTVAAPTGTEAGTLATLALLQGARARPFLQDQGVPFWCIA